MNKGGILGEVLEQAGSLAKQTAKQVVKTPLEVAKGAAEQIGVKPQTASSTETDLNKLKTKEEEKKAQNLAITRQKLAQMMTSSKPLETRPAERIERQKQQEQQLIQAKQAQKPPPLSVQKGKGTKEKLLGVSG